MGANAFGATATAAGNQSNAIGFNSKVDAENGIALGSYTKIEGTAATNSIAIGTSAKTNKISAIAIGQDANVSVNDKSVAIGAGSVDKLATQVVDARINDRNYSDFAGSNPKSVFLLEM